MSSAQPAPTGAAPTADPRPGRPVPPASPTLPPAAQAFAAIAAGRHSCRAFLPDPVDDAVIEQMFAIAQSAPSWCNAQPWQVVLTRPETTRTLGERLTAAASAGRMSSDIPGPAGYPGVYRDRRRTSGFALYSALGIGREDGAARATQMLRNFSFFGAPHVAIITAPPELGPYGGVDCGGYVTTLLLAARALGIDTVAQAAIGMVADEVHDALDIPSDRDIVCAVAFGYGDPHAPVNAFRTDRARLADVVHRV